MSSHIEPDHHCRGDISETTAKVLETYPSVRAPQLAMQEPPVRTGSDSTLAYGESSDELEGPLPSDLTTKLRKHKPTSSAQMEQREPSMMDPMSIYVIPSALTDREISAPTQTTGYANMVNNVPRPMRSNEQYHGADLPVSNNHDYGRSQPRDREQNASTQRTRDTIEPRGRWQSDSVYRPRTGREDEPYNGNQRDLTEIVRNAVESFGDRNHGHQVYTDKGFRRPERFGGKTPWNEYLTHFEMCAELNRWNLRDKAINLAASLDGSALQVFVKLT